MLFTFLFSLSLCATSTIFDFRDMALRNVAVFLSDAITQKIVAVNNILYGKAELDPTNLVSDIKIILEYDTRTFETGLISLNQFLKENIFASSKYPTIKLETKRIISKSSKRLGKDPVKIVAETAVGFRGVTKPERITFFITYFKLKNAKEILKIQCNFKLDLSSYGVVIDPLWQNEVAKTITFDLSATGRVSKN